MKIIKQVKSLAYNHVTHGAVDAGMKISRFEVCVLVVVLLDEHEPVRQASLSGCGIRLPLLLSTFGRENRPSTQCCGEPCGLVQ